jgi:hypothetical protein
MQRTKCWVLGCCIQVTADTKSPHLPAVNDLCLRFLACRLPKILISVESSLAGARESIVLQKSHLFTTTILSGTLVLGLFGTSVIAADIDIAKLPAVSAINGKIEIGGGFADLDIVDSDELFYGAASISLPLGDTFGLQVDGAVKDVFGETMVGGNMHLFMRDPGSYLVGAIAGYSDVGDANVAWVGGEAELYLDNISLEFAGGYMNVDPNGGSNDDEFFGFADAAFYPMENLRLALGASSVANFESAHVKAEWMLDAMPLAFTLEGRLGEDDFSSVTAGISFYFGGNQSDKSLMRRHREDDPRNRVLDIFGSGAAFVGDVAAEEDDPEDCPDGEVWNGEFCVPDLIVY